MLGRLGERDRRALRIGVTVVAVLVVSAVWLPAYARWARSASESIRAGQILNTRLRAVLDTALDSSKTSATGRAAAARWAANPPTTETPEAALIALVNQLQRGAQSEGVRIGVIRPLDASVSGDGLLVEVAADVEVSGPSRRILALLRRLESAREGVRIRRLHARLAPQPLESSPVVELIVSLEIESVVALAPTRSDP